MVPLWASSSSPARSLGDRGTEFRCLSWKVRPVIDKSRWGEGFATEAATAIAGYARTALEMQRLICLIMPNNLPSIRVAQKVGMAFERELTDEYGLCHVYSSSHAPRHRPADRTG